MRHSLFYKTLGDPKKPALVFFHGFLGSHKDWISLASKMTSSYFVILPDLPGHGQSDKTVLSFRSLAYSLQRLLKSLNRSSAGFIGYSMGGRIALYFSMYFPHLVSQLILISASPGIEDRSERRQRTLEDKKWANRFLTESLREGITEWYDQPLFASFRRHEAFQKVFHSRLNQNGMALSRVLETLSVGKQRPLWSKLNTQSYPLLYIAGEWDSKYMAIGKKMKSYRSDMSMEIISESGHVVYMEQEKKCLKRLREWLNKNKGLP